MGGPARAATTSTTSTTEGPVRRMAATRTGPTGAHPPDGAPGLVRIYLLRAALLVMGGGLAAVQWPTLVDHAQWSPAQGVVKSMFLALSLLGLLGVLRPLRMLPVLLFEIGWKAAWLTVVALPAWRAGAMDDAMRATLGEVLPIVVVAAVVPWPYVLRTYVTGPAEPWRRTARSVGTVRPDRTTAGP